MERQQGTPMSPEDRETLTQLVDGGFNIREALALVLLPKRQ